MTERQAERIANVVLGAAILGLSVYIVKTPALRRMVWQLTKAAAGAAGPWLAAELRNAWAESGAVAGPQQGDRQGPGAGL